MHTQYYRSFCNKFLASGAVAKHQTSGLRSRRSTSQAKVIATVNTLLLIDALVKGHVGY